MRPANPQGRVLFPAILSLSDESAALLNEMAQDMSISLDELISGIAEDSVSGLSQTHTTIQRHFPDSVSTQHLKDLIDK